MSQQTIEIEADTLEQARNEIKSQIPSGYYLQAERIISDGEPLVKEKQTIELEADNLDQARELIKSKIPEGYELVNERIIRDGKPKTATGTADTIENAIAQAKRGMPIDAQILEQKELLVPEEKMVLPTGSVDNSGRHSKAPEPRILSRLIRF